LGYSKGRWWDSFYCKGRLNYLGRSKIISFFIDSHNCFSAAKSKGILRKYRYYPRSVKLMILCQPERRKHTSLKRLRIFNGTYFCSMFIGVIITSLMKRIQTFLISAFLAQIA
jgi:hypothetical protein